MAYVADGTLLAGAEDPLWQVSPKREQSRVVKGVGGWVRLLAVDPTGGVAVSASDDQKIRLWRRDGTGPWWVQGRAISWRVHVPKLTRAACVFAGRDLTEEEWNRYLGSLVPYERACSESRSDFPGQ